MYCYECGKEILEGIKFCPYCGVSLLNSTNGAVSIDTNNKPSQSTESEFCMTIQDVFNISGRGNVVTGTIESGELHKGQIVKILDHGNIVYSVAGIEKKRSIVDSAKSGDSVGVLLPELNNTNDIKGKKLVSQNDELKSDDTPDYKELFGFAGQISSSGFSSSESESKNNNLFEDDIKTSSVNNEYGVPNQSVPNQSVPNQSISQPQGQYQNFTAFVTLRTGKGITAFSGLNIGNLTVSSNGIMFTMKIGNSSNNHSYSFDQIADAKFTMSHAGAMLQLSYNVTLKDGRKYIYMYGALEKSKLNIIDGIIKNNITK